MDQRAARTALLDAAEELFYGRGVQAVGMDDIRSASGVSLKRLYQLFPAKEQLVEAYLERRDERWRIALAAYVAERDDPYERVLAVFDWLGTWFADPGFRGCAWINCYGELGAVSPGVAEQARRHKEGFRSDLRRLVEATGLPVDPLAEELHLLAEGAIVTAGLLDDADAGERARSAAARLLAARGAPVRA
ncbi:TetR/AcrR family transcriptional regulator [Streptomyces sp. ICBB 8177]|uniref:TetR/AcrR family transcriptional regulator n=1 Tax=Streptomyces sp. ICBB 8177 TaxID=563922 RepID=UPI000D674B1F|nr:TetR/AcrR family transcriptional regulator [Streptomyces sp. ICBB 8177]PWI46147.1 TetR family transcriptional regulator [Streptomyces sp. ICBB 8177]